MREINRRSSGMFICSFPDCQASYDKEWKLNAHLCKHTGVRPFRCEYARCSKSFCTKSHLARHAVTHTGEKPFSCPEDGCTERFTTKFNVKKHIARKHKPGVKLYTCLFEGCGKSFKKNNLLKTHESTHTLQLPYECTYEGCDRRFANPSKRKRHEKVHKGYTCPAEDCSFVAKNWTELTKHRKEHKVRVQCGECKKTFRDQWFLKQHQRVHCETRLVLLCPRDGCERSYTTAFNLQSHILSFHEQQRAFHCAEPGCTKSFSMKKSLQRHAVVHDPERKKQKKPRPTQSLASRLSGYKRPKKGQTSEASKSDNDQAMSSPGPVKDDVTNATMADGAKIIHSEPLTSEHSVVLILEPLVLEGPMDSQSEINKSLKIAETSQSELSEFVNIVAVQSKFNQPLDVVMTSQ